MRIMTVALGTSLALCNLGTFSVAAHAQPKSFVNHGRGRPSGCPYMGQFLTGITILFYDIVIALRTTGSIHTARP